MDKVKPWTTVSILGRTKGALDEIKHEGQSYNGIIQELLKFREKKKGDYWSRRREQRAREESVGAQKE